MLHFSSVQLLSCVWLFATHGLQHTRPPCPPPIPETYSYSRRWCHQPSHPLSSPSPPVLNLSKHQGLFQWVGCLHQMTKILELVKNLPVMRETWVQPLGWEGPLEEAMATHSSILVWRIPMDRGAWRATVHGVAKNWTRLSDWTELIVYSYVYLFVFMLLCKYVL